MAESPVLSIIITSYTTERLADISELLDSARVQTYGNIETIFVAERSSDLYEGVKEYTEAKAAVNMKVLFNDGESGLSAARNVGLKEARGDIIAFVDDDTVLFRDWAEEMIKAYQDSSIIGVTGPALPLWEDKSMSWFPEEFYWIISCTAWSGWNEVREVRNAWGMNMSFRREAFEKCGVFLNEFGFHKGPMAEDNEFSLRVRAQTGKRIIYSPTVRLSHRVHRYRLSWGFIKERAYWIGHSRYTLQKLRPQAEADQAILLSQERQLLKRVFSRLLPSIARDFFTRPIVAWRRLSVTVFTLYFVALGYYSHSLPVLRQPEFSGERAAK